MKLKVSETKMKLREEEISLLEEKILGLQKNIRYFIYKNNEKEIFCFLKII